MTRCTLIQEEDIYRYCCSDATARHQFVHGVVAGGEFPVAVLPVFEVCRAIYFGALKKGIRPADFHDCWQNFVTDHWQYRERGFPVTLANASMDPVNLAELFLEVGLIDVSEESNNLDEDDRDRRSAHPALTNRFREMQKTAVSRLDAMKRPERRAQCEPPEYLTELDATPSISSDDLVLDTNIFLELINRLSLTEPVRKRPMLSDRFSDAAKNRAADILLSNGALGGLIVPSNVIEEAERVARIKSTEYEQARKVLRAILTEPDYPLWSSFRLEPLSLGIVGAFIQIEQVLFEKTQDLNIWPDFSDAIVLAYGRYFGCPVASSEWDDKEKPDWENMAKLFNGLRI